MATLGIVLLWGGYTIGVFGFAKIKSAYGLSPSLSISDLALPSHRATYLAAATSWGNQVSTPGAGSTPATGGAAGIGAPGGTQSGPTAAPVPGQTIVTPTTPGGLKGIDLNGNTYTRTCSTCPWTLSNIANLGKPSTE